MSTAATLDNSRTTPAGGWLRRRQGLVRGVSMAVILIATVLLLRALPIEQGVARLQGYVAGLGAWGYVIFGAVYVASALLLIPGSALTLAAGAVFGLWRGFLLVVISATTASLLAFLIARYLARSRIEQLARRNRRFGAVDAAVGEGGWKVVAMLRLSPVIPYSLSNYLFGLTPVRFTPYALATLFGMMPGTLLYVYLGYAGRRTVGGGLSWQEWVFLGVGLAVTVVVTVYLARLARRKLKERTPVIEQAEPAPPPEDRPLGWGTFILPVIALLLVAAVPFRAELAGRVVGLFGPPAVTMQEMFAGTQATAEFDHSDFDALLARHVDEHGLVDYPALNRERDQLEAYIARLATAPIDRLGRDGRLALLINAYNAFMLQLVLDHPEAQDVIRDIPEPFKRQRWTLAGRRVSLDDVEHRMIRPNFTEPRIHWAVVCGAFSCPKLRNEAYVPGRLEEQLDDQARYVHSHARYIQYDGGDVIRLTPLYRWYAGDFEQSAGSVLDYVARYRPDLQARLDAGRPPRVEFLEYSWALNAQANRAKLEAIESE